MPKVTHHTVKDSVAGECEVNHSSAQALLRGKLVVVVKDKEDGRSWRKSRILYFVRVPSARSRERGLAED